MDESYRLLYLSPSLLKDSVKRKSAYTQITTSFNQPIFCRSTGVRSTSPVEQLFSSPLSNSWESISSTKSRFVFPLTTAQFWLHRLQLVVPFICRARSRASPASSAVGDFPHQTPSTQSASPQASACLRDYQADSGEHCINSCLSSRTIYHLSILFFLYYRQS